MGYYVVMQHFFVTNIAEALMYIYIHIQHLYPEDGNSMFVLSLTYQLAGYKVPYIRPQTVNIQLRENLCFIENSGF